MADICDRKSGCCGGVLGGVPQGMTSIEVPQWLLEEMAEEEEADVQVPEGE